MIPAIPTAETSPPLRILFVFAWLAGGGEETELRLLARHLDPRRYRIEALPCFRKPGTPDPAHAQLAALGVQVDATACDLSFDETVAHLARRLSDCDLVVSSQNVADIYPALERLALRPPLIERGGLVSEALAGPKHFTARYAGACARIRDAAAARMPGRARHAVEIPPWSIRRRSTPRPVRSCGRGSASGRRRRSSAGSAGPIAGRGQKISCAPPPSSMRPSPRSAS